MLCACSANCSGNKTFFQDVQILCMNICFSSHKHVMVNLRWSMEEKLVLVLDAIESSDSFYTGEIDIIKNTAPKSILTTIWGMVMNDGPLEWDILDHGTVIYLWTQTAWGRSWPGGVWCRVRGSGPSLATREERKWRGGTRGREKVRKKKKKKNLTEFLIDLFW